MPKLFKQFHLGSADPITVQRRSVHVPFERLLLPYWFSLVK